MARKECLSRYIHFALYGEPRLKNVVQALMSSHPWAKSVSGLEMIRFLSSECEELQEELRSPTININQLYSEMGDILFDTTFLLAICERDFGLKREICFQKAAEKIEWRTPHMLWGKHYKPDVTIQETEEMWRKRKRSFKAKNFVYSHKTRQLFSDVLNTPFMVLIFVFLAGLCFGQRL